MDAVDAKKFWELKRPNLFPKILWHLWMELWQLWLIRLPQLRLGGDNCGLFIAAIVNIAPIMITSRLKIYKQFNSPSSVAHIFMGLECSARICYTEPLLNFLMEAVTGIFSPDTFLFHGDYYAVVLILLLL